MKWSLVACALGAAVLAAFAPLAPSWVRWLSLATMAALVGSTSYSSYRPGYEYLRDRRVDRGHWSRVFSAEQLPLVLDVLDSVRDAFALRKDDIGRLQPADRLLDIYRAAYRSRW